MYGLAKRRGSLASLRLTGCQGQSLNGRLNHSLIFHQQYRAVELLSDGHGSLDHLRKVFSQINSYAQTDYFSLVACQAGIIGFGVSPKDNVPILFRGSLQEPIDDTFQPIVVRDIAPRLAQIPSLVR